MRLTFLFIIVSHLINHNFNFMLAWSASWVLLYRELSYHNYSSWEVWHDIFNTFLFAVEEVRYPVTQVCRAHFHQMVFFVLLQVQRWNKKKTEKRGKCWFALRFLSHVNPLCGLRYSKLTWTDVEKGRHGQPRILWLYHIMEGRTAAYLCWKCQSNQSTFQHNN